VPTDHKVHRALRDLPARRDCKALKDSPVLQVQSVRWDLSGRWAPQESLVQWEQQVLKVRKGFPAYPAPRALRVPLGLKEFQDPRLVKA